MLPLHCFLLSVSSVSFFIMICDGRFFKAVVGRKG